MTKKEIFDIWAPPGSIWSNWVKPILFSQLMKSESAATPAELVFAIPANDSRTILIIDLPGAAAAEIAVELANRGFRPVPMYNCAAPPSGIRSAINVLPIMVALINGAHQLRWITLPNDAPPAFLLDANRRYGEEGFSGTGGSFDNRSISLPADFPSGNLLLSHGLTRAIVIQRKGDQPKEDLRHTLLRWQQAGIEIQVMALDENPTPEPIIVVRPNWFKVAWYSALAVMGFKQSPLGGFGGMLAEYSGGAG